MNLFSTLRQLIARLPTLPDDASIYLPEKLALPDATGGFAVLLSADARFLAQPADAAPRMGYRLWLDVRGLRRIVADLAPPRGEDYTDDALLAALTAHLGRANPDEATSPAAPPPLVWPAFTADEEEMHLAWWRACVLAYADLWAGHASQPRLQPASRAELDALEQRLGCALPPLLRAYHARIGALNLCETLCSVTPAQYANIEPLQDAYPGISDILEDAPDAERRWALVKQLVAFGDYLGNGNLWCFHRQTGAVWYFDHDTAPMLTEMFPDVGGYLDALMFKCLLEVYGEDDTQQLRRHLGDAVVDKWMY